MVLSEVLIPWRELNVAAFLTSGITASESGPVGEERRYADAEVGSSRLDP